MSGIVQGLLASFSSAAAVVTDAYFYLVTLLLNTTTTNGAQNNTFLDSSSNAFTITRNGNTTQGTFTPFSQTGWSNYLTQASNNLSVASSSSLASGTSSFTLEFWYNSGATGNGRPMGNGGGGAYGTNSWVVGSNNTAGKIELFVYNYNTSTAMLSSTSSSVASDNQWHHVVFVRSSNTWAMFLDGTRQGSSVTSSVSFNGTSSGITIGGSGVSGDTATAFVGYISNVRFVNGSAVYDPTQTTITVPTTPLTPITNTALLTCQSNQFIDTNTQVAAKTITVTGSPSVQAFSPFAPTAAYSAANVGGSGYFDGNGDYLLTAASSNMSVGASDFTIEFWFYPTSLAALQYPIWSTNAGAKADVLTFEITTAGVVNAQVTQSGGAAWSIINAGNMGTVRQNAWNHIALSRSGSTWRGFVNGVQGLTVTSSATVSAFNGFSIGAYATPAGYITGYLCGLREVVGTAVYTAAFTPPTAPPTAITNTQLLLNFTNAGIYDAAAKNDLETVGNAQVSTTQAKFGTTSMYFDGTGARLVPPSNVNYAMGSGDFTWEAWVYFASGSTFRQIFSTRASSSTASTTAGSLSVNTTNGLTWFTNAAIVSYATSIGTSQWVHVAVCRSGTTLRVFANGSSVGSATNSDNLTASILSIGGNNDGTEPFNGYIDEVRITKYARYTSSTYTVPTAAFPVQ